MISLLNFQAELPTIPVPAKFSIRAPGGGKIKRIVSVPENRSLDFSTTPDGMVTAEVEPIRLLTMLIANYEN